MELIVFVGMAAVCSLVLYYIVRSAVRDGQVDAHRFLQDEARLARMRDDIARSRSQGAAADPPEAPRA